MEPARALADSKHQSTPGKNNVAGVLGGRRLEWRTREGVSFFDAAETIGMSDSRTVYDARGGIRVAF